ncbi:hypothetical protein SMC26_12155 [Actinomadura fulvescens]|uniref:Uncharacterized protein n=1 Tax=Actinomadura fulvescens TaxID=46160 RepID=A0ABP6BTL5_9ACTN
MGLRERLVRFAAARPRPFVIVAPGGTATRLVVESELRSRGWVAASAPASANVLVICGDRGAGTAAAAEVVWQDMPSPRSRVSLGPAVTRDEVAAALDQASRELADGEQGHHTGAPAELAMADRADDRDGLKLDVLHVDLGPALAHWPAGLVVRLSLQGDVVQAAGITVPDLGGVSSFWGEPWTRAAAGERVQVGEAERRRAAARLDSVARLLAVAGWQSAAEQASRLRDEVLGGGQDAGLVGRYARFVRRTGRSRTLRWMLRDLGVIDQAAAERHGLRTYTGDVAARLNGWLTEAGRSLERMDDPRPLEGDDGPIASAAILAVLPVLLEGAELAAARLIVASLDPDLERLAVGAEAGGG